MCWAFRVWYNEAMSAEFLNFFKPWLGEFEAYLAERVKTRVPELLWESMAYSLLDGGKRMRPLLCFSASVAVSGHWQGALPAASAIEMIHSYSLIHDDLPALDNDDWRRGKASSHKRFGEAMAILAGDALLTYAFDLLSEPGELEPALQLQVLRELAQAAGPLGMCGGQVIDMHSQAWVQTAEDVLQVYRLKTGALIRASVRMGALVGGANPEQLQALTHYAEQLGKAFQLIDDLLDLTGSLDTLGKTPGKDLAQDKKTYPALAGVNAARQAAQDCLNQALQNLNSVSLQQPEALKKLAHWLVQRET